MHSHIRDNTRVSNNQACILLADACLYIIYACIITYGNMVRHRHGSGHIDARLNFACA